MTELKLDHSPTMKQDGSIPFTTQENKNVHERQNSNIRH